MSDLKSPPRSAALSAASGPVLNGIVNVHWMIAWTAMDDQEISTAWGIMG